MAHDTEAKHLLARIEGVISDDRTRKSAAMALTRKIAEEVGVTSNVEIGASPDPDGCTIQIADLAYRVIATGRGPILSRFPFESGIGVLPNGRKDIPIELVFDGLEWFSEEVDTFIAPTPGMPVPRRSAVAVVLRVICDDLAAEAAARRRARVA